MRLEDRLGFRSCFNFVPRGEYESSDEIRALLRDRGFEVGVHGLHHDGRLYASKKGFARKSERIRSYMESWGACGFRSPLMQHRLGWLHELGVSYDSSTFDTDPFEPEPDGVGTVFPFWVPDSRGAGYVELPYTLVQDFTLFVILGEKTTDIWKQKVDWIRDRGGMVLLNTHPDYMSFDGTVDRDEYPASRYEEFLQWLRDKYEGEYWTALPRDVNQHYREAMPYETRNTRRKICMVAYTFYELDNRVRRYAETLAKRGDQVDVIALSGVQFKEPVEQINGVTVYRVQYREYNETSKWTYAKRLLAFLARSSSHLTKLHKLNRYDVIHVHNMPDFLVFSAWYPKLKGAKVVLDIHDIVPELFDNKFKTTLKQFYVWALKCIEKVSARCADHVIVSNDLWRETLTKRSVESEKCSVFVNNVDLSVFYRHTRTRTDERFIVLFPGSLQWHQGLDIAIEAFAKFKNQVPSAEFHIYSGGGGDMKSSLVALAESLHVGDSVKFFEGVPLDEIPDLIANADLGVVPKRADSFGNEAYSTKIMEFMSQGLPVVASRTKIDTFYFDDSAVHFFESGNSDAMARAMLEVYRDNDLRARLIERGIEYSDQHSWERKKQEYLDLIDRLSTEDFGRPRGTSDVQGEIAQTEPGRKSSEARSSVTSVAQGGEKSEAVQVCE